MKTFKHYVKFAMPLIAAVAFLMTSCSGLKDKEAQVPQNAIFVANINVGSMWQKGELSNVDNIKSYGVLREGLSAAMPQLEQLLTNLLKDPSTTGIDTDKDLLLFAAMNGENLSDITVTFSATLKSKEAFTDFLNKASDIAGEKLAIEEGDLSYANLDKDIVMAFNNKSVVIIAGGKSGSQKDYAKSLFELKESLADNDHYKAYLDNRQDMGLFLPFANWFGEKGIMNNPMLKVLMTNANEALYAQLEKCSAYSVTSFENGSIVTTCKTLGNPTDNAKFLGKGIDNSLMAFMPSPTLTAFSFSVDMPACLEYIANDKASAEAFNESIEELGCTVKDIVEIFAGNFVGSFYGMGKGNMPLCAVAADIAKADLVNNFLQSAGLKAKNNVYDLGSGMSLFFDGKTIAFSTDANAPKAYAQGGYQNSLAVVADKIRKGNYFYMDLKIQDYPQAVLDLLDYKAGNDALLDQVLSLLDYLEVVTTAPDEMKIILKLTDSRNALATIIATADDIAMSFLGADEADETLALED